MSQTSASPDDNTFRCRPDPCSNSNGQVSNAHENETGGSTKANTDLGNKSGSSSSSCQKKLTSHRNVNYKVNPTKNNNTQRKNTSASADPNHTQRQLHKPDSGRQNRHDAKKHSHDNKNSNNNNKTNNKNRSSRTKQYQKQQRNDTASQSRPASAIINSQKPRLNARGRRRRTGNVRQHRNTSQSDSLHVEAHASNMHLTPDQQEMAEQFMSLSGTNIEFAASFLQGVSWSLDTATQVFLGGEAPPVHNTTVTNDRSSSRSDNVSRRRGRRGKGRGRGVGYNTEAIDTNSVEHNFENTSALASVVQEPVAVLHHMPSLMAVDNRLSHSQIQGPVGRLSFAAMIAQQQHNVGNRKPIHLNVNAHAFVPRINHSLDDPIRGLVTLGAPGVHQVSAADPDIRLHLKPNTSSTRPEKEEQEEEEEYAPSITSLKSIASSIVYDAIESAVSKTQRAAEQVRRREFQRRRRELQLKRRAFWSERVGNHNHIQISKQSNATVAVSETHTGAVPVHCDTDKLQSRTGRRKGIKGSGASSVPLPPPPHAPVIHRAELSRSTQHTAPDSLHNGVISDPSVSMSIGDTNSDQRHHSMFVQACVRGDKQGMLAWYNNLITSLNDPSSHLFRMEYSRVVAYVAGVANTPIHPDASMALDPARTMRRGQLSGHTLPLFAAVRTGDAEVVRLLLDWGADPGAKAKGCLEGSSTAVHIAAKMTNALILDVLFRHASMSGVGDVLDERELARNIVNVKDYDGRTALHLLCDMPESFHNNNNVYDEDNSGIEDTDAYISDSNVYDDDDDDDDDTNQLQGRARQCAHLLLDAGASMSIRNQRGDTALLAGIRAGNTDCVNELLTYSIRKRDPSLQALVDTLSTHDGLSALALAAKQGMGQLAGRLVRLSSNASGVGGKDVLFSALWSGNSDLVRYVLGRWSKTKRFRFWEAGDAFHLVCRAAGDPAMVDLMFELWRDDHVDIVTRDSGGSEYGSKGMCVPMAMNTNAKSYPGDTPLMVALRYRHWECARHMLNRYGSSITATNTSNEVPLVVALQAGTTIKTRNTTTSTRGDVLASVSRREVDKEGQDQRLFVPETLIAALMPQQSDLNVTTSTQLLLSALRARCMGAVVLLLCRAGGEGWDREVAFDVPTVLCEISALVAASWKHIRDKQKDPKEQTNLRPLPESTNLALHYSRFQQKSVSNLWIPDVLHDMEPSLAVDFECLLPIDIEACCEAGKGEYLFGCFRDSTVLKDMLVNRTEVGAGDVDVVCYTGDIIPDDADDDFAVDTDSESESGTDENTTVPIRVHLLVLAARCPYIEGLLRHSSNKVRRVDLAHHSAESVMHLIVYLYTARVPQLVSTLHKATAIHISEDTLLHDLQSALDLLLLADELLVPALHIHCQLCITRLLLQLRKSPTSKQFSHQEATQLCQTVRCELIERAVLCQGTTRLRESVPVSSRRRRRGGAVSRLLCWSNIRTDNGMLPAIQLRICVDETVLVSSRTDNWSSVTPNSSTVINLEALQTLGGASLEALNVLKYETDAGFFVKAKTLDEIESYLRESHAVYLTTDMEKQLELNDMDVCDSDISNVWPCSPVGWNTELVVPAAGDGSVVVFRCHRAVLYARSAWATNLLSSCEDAVGDVTDDEELMDVVFSGIHDLKSEDKKFNVIYEESNSSALLEVGSTEYSINENREGDENEKLWVDNNEKLGVDSHRNTNTNTNTKTNTNTRVSVLEGISSDIELKGVDPRAWSLWLRFQYTDRVANLREILLGTSHTPLSMTESSDRLALISGVLQVAAVTKASCLTTIIQSVLVQYVRDKVEPNDACQGSVHGLSLLLIALKFKLGTLVQEVLGAVSAGAWLGTRQDVLVWTDWLQSPGKLSRVESGMDPSLLNERANGDSRSFIEIPGDVDVHPAIVAAIAAASMWEW